LIGSFGCSWVHAEKREMMKMLGVEDEWEPLRWRGSEKTKE